MKKTAIFEKTYRQPSIIRLTSSLKSPVLLQIICFLIIVLFVYAASSKLLDYQKFKVQLGQSPMLTSYAPILAILVPLVEILISLLLLTNRFKLLALYASFTLMIIFTAYIVAITKFSSFVPCSCGGVLQKMTWNQHLIFNIAFVLIPYLGIELYTKINKSSL